MERKIGEIFGHNDEWYQCIKGNTCNDCAFYRSSCGSLNGKGSCRYNFREDTTNVIFKKLEKVGEPYEFDEHLFQSYHTFEVPIFTENYATVREVDNNLKISIEIKQTKEDMEDKKLNLKPFNIQKAREGKPVCTRDGRKARIISCSLRNKNFPIAAIVEDEEENVYQFEANGVCDEHDENLDLMMLPEKKEGWVNVYKGGLLDTRVYNTKKGAFDKASPIDYVDTVKIEWRE